MNSDAHPVRNFFYENNDQPGFSFERFFPISLLENQKNSTGNDFRYANDEYLKVAYTYKTLHFAIKESLFLDETKKFLSNLVSNLPIIFPETFIKQWRNEEFAKIKEFLAPTEASLYQEYLDNNLAKAYFFSGVNGITYNVWTLWIEKVATYQQLSELIYYNWKKFERSAQAGFGKDELNTTIDWMSDFFDLNKKEKQILNLFYFEEKNRVLSYIVNNSQSLRYYPMMLNTEDQVEWFAKIYDVNKSDIISFFKNQCLIETGLIKNVLKGDLFFSDVALEHKPISDVFFGPKFLTLLLSKFETKQHFIDTLINIEKDLSCNLTTEDYAYLDPELESIIKAISAQDKPVDILLWGNPGTGKTELVKAIAKKLEFSLCNIVKFDQDGRDNFYQNQRMFQLCAAKKFSTILSDYIILIDEAEEILTQKEIKHLLTEQLENKKVHTIWIVNHIENIHPAYLRRFDYIQEINGMPFDYRKNLALKLLADKAENNKDLAYKIAQAMHTPAEIVSSVNWCHQTHKYTWANVLVKMAGYQKAVSKSQKTTNRDFIIEIIPPELNAEKGLKNFAGYQYLHEEARKIKDIFNNPEKYQKIGAKIPKGILLAGEPGVGKTLFAKCLANEISIPIIKADSSALASNPGAMAELFEQARSQAPCMIFLDEIDVIASNIMDKNGANTEKQKILNQLLVQMEGFDSLDGVMALGATHRHHLLDSAVTRSGRFGDTLYFRSPSQEDRVNIWKYYSKNVSVEDNINYDLLAKLSATMSAADICQCVNMAAMNAAIEDSSKISQLHFENACNKLFWGTDAQGLPITKKEQWKTAIHEAGHALIALKNKQGIRRITVRPHLNFLGAVDLERPEGVYSTTLSQIKQNTEIFFGGMLAEEIIFNHHANGVTSDLSKASSFVMEALLSYGMSTTLGSVVITQNTPAMSDSRVIALETEHKSILDESRKIAQQWLQENKQTLVDLASHLIEKRSLSQSELYSWFDKKLSKEQMHFIEEDNDCSFEQMIAMAQNSTI